MNLPIFTDHERGETLLILITKFNQMIRDGDLFKDDRLSEEYDLHTLSGDQLREKLNSVKSLYRKFEACLEDNTRDKWEQLVDYQVPLAGMNYTPGNTYSIENFFENQKLLASYCLTQDSVFKLKSYLQKTKKPRETPVELWIKRVQTLNNYIPLMESGARKLDLLTLIKNVIMDNLPEKWICDLKRANNHKHTNLEELISVLKPLEEAN